MAYLYPTSIVLAWTYSVTFKLPFIIDGVLVPNKHSINLDVLVNILVTFHNRWRTCTSISLDVIGNFSVIFHNWWRTCTSIYSVTFKLSFTLDGVLVPNKHSTCLDVIIKFNLPLTIDGVLVLFLAWTYSATYKLSFTIGGVLVPNEHSTSLGVLGYI